MDKFSQRVTLIEKELDPALKEAVDIQGIGSFLGMLKQLAFGTSNEGEFDASNVYYLVGGSKSLPKLATLLQFNVHQTNINKVMDIMEKNTERVKLEVKKATTLLNSAINQHKDTTKEEAILATAEEKLNALETDNKDTLAPFDENGNITRTKSNLQRIGKGQYTTDINEYKKAGFKYGEDTLPAVLYNAFTAATTTQGQNYIKLIELIQGELRSRKKYSVKLDLSGKHINYPNAHASLMRFIKTIDGLDKLIRYITPEKAAELQKQEKGGGIIKRGLKSIGGNYLNSISKSAYEGQT
jgi:hypothetical protein